MMLGLTIRIVGWADWLGVLLGLVIVGVIAGIFEEFLDRRRR